MRKIQKAIEDFLMLMVALALIGTIVFAIWSNLGWIGG